MLEAVKFNTIKNYIPRLKNIPTDSFARMDELSQQGTAFFFMIDFRVQQIEIYLRDEILPAGLCVDFRGFKSDFSTPTYTKKLQLKLYPESKESYRQGFEKVQAHIMRGDSYVLNYTCKTKIESNFSLSDFFHFAHAKYKVLYKDEFVFFSPETFVEIKGSEISTEPMKGTIDAGVLNAESVLKKNNKERAEHYTVVDLLRNDLSKVARDVHVRAFQRVDFIKTSRKNLYAMSTEIVGTLRPALQHKIGTIMRDLLPAGSILGAPKAKTMKIVLSAENYARHWYTGVCGYFDGANLDSCVMIRFIEKDAGVLYFKSGGGITHRSKLDDEYQEMKNKIYVPIC